MTAHDDALARIRALRAQITPGTWEMYADDYHIDDIRVCNVKDGKCICCLVLMGNIEDEADVDQWNADAAFIAAAPAAIDAYEAALAAERARADALEAALREMDALATEYRARWTATLDELAFIQGYARGEGYKLMFPHDTALNRRWLKAVDANRVLLAGDAAADGA